MKKITYLFIILLTLVGSVTQASIALENVVKFNDVHENTIAISSQFGQAFIDENTDLSALKNMEIHHVDLVYTAFRVSDDFNQQALNEKRMRRLIALLPQLGKKDPSWRAICQTGAKTVADAKQYFHGFVLHFGDDLSYGNQAKFFENFQQKPIVRVVDNSQSSTLQFESGTTISIPPNAVVDKDGRPVKGNYDLVYQEFRDAADIVYSGIPMTFSSSGTDYNFSSVGMYEVRANQNGKELQLNKPIQIDFNATDVKADVGFFQMDDKTGEWEKLEDIDFGMLDTDEIVNELEVKGVFIQWSYSQREKSTNYTFSKDLYSILENHLDTIPNWKSRLQKVNKEKGSFSLPSKYVADFNEVINDSYTELLKSPEFKAINNEDQELPLIWEPEAIQIERTIVPAKRDNDIRATLLAEGSSDPGHTYPNLVKGLNSSKFGVYNCDQIYRIGRSQTVTPTYVDVKTGKEIKNKRVTCVMDLTYNGAFSFQPNYLTCNVEGKNVILLFTTDKKTYMLDAEEFNKLNVTENNRPVFAMTDMTDQLKTSKDLSRILKL